MPSLSEKKARLREVREEHVFRMKHERYRFYEPTGKLEEFIKMVGSGKIFVCLLSAANGIGKSLGGANIYGHLFWPCGNKYFQAPLFKNWPYPRAARIITGPNAIVSNLIPMLKRQFPANRYSTNKKGKHYEAEWTTDTGWRMDIMSYDQDPKEFESSTLGIVWFDEPPPESIFKATVARMRKGGVIFITATPLAGSAWMYDHILDNPDKELAEKGQRDFIEATVESACKIHGVRGFLEHEDIERMVSEYTEDEKWARAFGKFHHLVGLVFKEFSRKIHVIPPFIVNRREYVVVELLDPHPRNPDAVTWVALDKNGIWRVVDELTIKAQTSELGARIKAKGDNYRIVKRLADPSAFIVDQHTGKSLAGDLAGMGLVYEPATKDRSYSDRTMQDFMHFTMVGDQMLQKPMLYYFETCETAIRQTERWRWAEWKGKTGEERDPKEEKIDKDDHHIENIGRALVSGIIWTPPPPTTPVSDRIIKDDPFE